MKSFSSQALSRSRRGFVMPLMLATVAIITTVMIAQLVALKSVRDAQVNQTERLYREVDSWFAVDVIREAFYDFLEISTYSPGDTVQDTIDAGLDRISNSEIDVSVSSIDASLTTPPITTNQFFPNGTPVFAGAGFNQTTSFAKDQRTFRIVKDGMRYVDLLTGELTVDYDYLDASRSTGDTSYNFAVQAIGLPLTNFSLLGYSMPATGTVPSSPPANFTGSGIIEDIRSDGGEVAMVNLKTPDTTDNSFPDVYADDGSLPYYYRNDVSLLWNTFEYLMGPAHQSNMLTNAQSAGSFIDIASITPGDPSTYPTGVSVTPASPPHSYAIRIDLDTFSPDDPVFVLSTTDAYLFEFLSSGSGALPQNVVFRFSSSTSGRCSIRFNTTEPIIFWGFGVDIFDSPLPMTGMVFIDDRSVISDTGFDLTGTLAFDLVNEPLSPAALTGFNLNPFTPAQSNFFSQYAPFASLLLVEKR